MWFTSVSLNGHDASGYSELKADYDLTVFYFSILFHSALRKELSIKASLTHICTKRLDLWDK